MIGPLISAPAILIVVLVYPPHEPAERDNYTANHIDIRSHACERLTLFSDLRLNRSNIAYASLRDIESRPQLSKVILSLLYGRSHLFNLLV